jgi:predicted amidophosphoribosyltransferase
MELPASGVLQCQQCGQQVSSSAEVCPHCGAPSETFRAAAPCQPKIPPKIQLLLIVLFAVLMILGATNW